MERGVGKIILFLVIAFVVYALIKGAGRTAKRRENGARQPESMVACAQCGVNLPRSEALEAAGRYFCSEEHRRLGAR